MGSRQKLRYFDYETSSGDAFAKLLAGLTQTFSAHLNRILVADESTAPHEARIALRRIRAALRAMPLDDHAALDGLAVQLATLGRRVGRVRDGDVLVEDILDPACEQAQAQALALDFDGLRALLAEENSNRRRDLRNELAAKPARELLIGLENLPHQLEAVMGEQAATQIGAHVGKVLPKTWRRLARKAQAIDDLSIEELHELRKSAKTFRYQFELFAPLYPDKAAAQLIDKLKAMQRELGYLNDVANAAALVDLAMDASDDAKLGLAAGYVLGFHNARCSEARSRINAAWSKLAGTKLAENGLKL